MPIGRSLETTSLPTLRATPDEEIVQSSTEIRPGPRSAFVCFDGWLNLGRNFKMPIYFNSNVLFITYVISI